MLIKYKLLVNDSKQKYKEIICDNLYISDDKSFISGVTSADYYLYGGSSPFGDIPSMDMQDIYLAKNENNSTMYKYQLMSVDYVWRQGYILYDKVYELKHFTHYLGDVYYFEHDEWNYYFCINENNEQDVLTFNIKELNKTITIERNRKTHEFPRIISCPTRIWVEDNTITVDDYGSSLTVDFNDYATPNFYEKEWLQKGATVAIEGNIYPLYHYQPSERVQVIKFRFNKVDDLIFDIEELLVMSKREYILFGGSNKSLKCCENELDDTKELYERKKCYIKEKWLEDEEKWVRYYEEGIYEFQGDLLKDFPSTAMKCISGTVEIQDTYFPIYTEWEVDGNGEYIKINYADDTQNIQTYDKIIAKSLDYDPITCLVIGISASISGLSENPPKPPIPHYDNPNLINDLDSFDGNIETDLLEYVPKSTLSGHSRPYILFSNKKYYVEGLDENSNYTDKAIRKIVYNGSEYELFFDSDGWGWIYPEYDEYNQLKDGSPQKEKDVYKNYPLYAHAYIVHYEVPTLFRVSQDKTTAVQYSNYYVDSNNIIRFNVLDINTYLYVEINDNKYSVDYDYKWSNIFDDEGNIIDQKITDVIYYVTIYESEEFELTVIEKIGSNELFCRIEGEEDKTIANILHYNYKNYLFTKKNYFLDDEWWFDFRRLYDNNVHEIKDIVRLYNNEEYFPINIPFNNSMGINLHQFDIVSQQFADKEINERLNRIIDMEKDIYYPTKKMSNGKLINVNKIEFYLHFRDRSDEKNIVSSNWEFNELNEWNITEYYDKDDIIHKEDGKPSFQYFQPSDLLYFLGFTDNDVYYQKSKIGKSFLRLSFYDSPNPRTQSLLTTSTLFLNEYDYYLKYINNTNRGGTFTKMVITNKKGFKNEKGDVRRMTDLISVSSESYDKIFDFNDDKRLSSAINVNNMHETNETSEGFYLHMFKEYSTQYIPRTIYMKVEFSHASKGKTINFFCPMVNTNTLLNEEDEQSRHTKALRKFTEDNKLKDGTNVTSFLSTYCCYDTKTKTIVPKDNNQRKDYQSQGVSLSELYDCMYIPINVLYDAEKKQYVYYLDNEMNGENDDSVLRFNLYELKIKDES